MKIEIDDRFWYAAGRIWKRFWTIQESGSKENRKWHFVSRFGIRWMRKNK
jgi:hypothetical protein